jgi:hypothetical protein
MTKNLICRLKSHKFSDWEYVSDHTCQQVRICQQCGVQEKRTWHDWDAGHVEERWEPVNQPDGSGLKVRHGDDVILIQSERVRIRHCRRHGCPATDES